MPNQIFEYHPEAVKEAHRTYHWYDERSEIAADDSGKSFGGLDIE
jgi:hypothetical protein